MSAHYPDIRERDDGLYEVINGAEVAGPFPTIAFAMRVASGEKPVPIDKVGERFKRFRVIREAPINE